MEKRILLIGASGQVGWELLRCLQLYGTVIAADKTQGTEGVAYIDLADSHSIRQVITELKPHIIVNAAAYTTVDKAEQERELTLLLNATAPGILAEMAKQSNALLIHYSTDYVFDGTQRQPYIETDQPNPLGVYGQSKLAGDQAIQAVGGKYLILRTAWVYGLRGQNFLLTMQRLAQERAELRIVDDQYGAPTWSRLIAEATAAIIAQVQSPLYQAEMTALSGIYHLTCGGQTTWYHFAKAIMAHLPKQPRLVPITTAEYPTPAQRPAYSVLANTKLATTFGITLPAWEQALALCLHSRLP